MHVEDIETLTDFLFVEHPGPKGDVALAFGTRHHSNLFGQRIAHLWQGGAFGRIVFSGYQGEARLMADAARAEGVPESVIDLEEAAANTGDNVRLSQDLLRKAAPGKTLLAVTKSYSARRCLLTALKYLPDWRIAVAPVDYFGVSRDSWMRSPAFVDKALEELVKIPDYAARGFIAAPDDKRFTPERLYRLAENLALWRESLNS